jgi:hypothetical protein
MSLHLANFRNVKDAFTYLLFIGLWAFRICPKIWELIPCKSSSHLLTLSHGHAHVTQANQAYDDLREKL